MVRWHQQLNGHEFEQALGAGEGQGGLVCCSPWGPRVGHGWATEQRGGRERCLRWLHVQCYQVRLTRRAECSRAISYIPESFRVRPECTESFRQEPVCVGVTYSPRSRCPCWWNSFISLWGYCWSPHGRGTEPAF